MPIRTSYAQKRTNSNKKRYYKALKYPEIQPSLDDIYMITSTGDRLDILAEKMYKDVTLWWIIAIANPDTVRRDSLVVKGGLELRIPLNTDKIIEEFENLNKE